MRAALIISLGASIVMSTALSGCATTISAIKARPVAAHDVHPTRLWTSTGERRFVTWLDMGNDHYLLCPEPVPFTAQAITSSSKPSFARSGVVTLSTDEVFNTGLTSIGTLTENLAALDRNFSNSCNLFVAGIMTPEELRKEVEDDNGLRRNYVMLSALKAEEKELQEKIDKSVKEAVDKLKKASSGAAAEDAEVAKAKAACNKVPEAQKAKDENCKKVKEAAG